jgi:hypothetical protein
MEKSVAIDTSPTAITISTDGSRMRLSIGEIDINDSMSLTAMERERKV